VWFYSFLPGGEKFYMVRMAAVCWAIWILRNKMMFEKYIHRKPAEIVFMVCSFLMHWAGLQKEGDKMMLASGVKKLMSTAASWLLELLYDEIVVPFRLVVDAARC
jgi:hypothetical protein